MPRLPQPGSDANSWGNILNDFLSVEHNSDGTLKKTATFTAALSTISQTQATANQAAATAQAANTTATAAQTTANGKYTKPGSGIPETDLAAAVQTKLNQGGAVADNSLTNVKIATNAAIDQSKIANLTTDLSAKATTSALTSGLAGKVSKGELIFNVKDYGAVGNGSTDDGPAIEAAITALVAVPNSFGQVGVLYFPPGRYLDGSSHSNSDAKRFNVRGSGMYTTILQRNAAATGDWWTFEASFSGARDITFEGGRYQASGSADAIVLNGGYTYLSDVAVNKAKGNGISIGKTGPAIAHRLTNLMLRENAGYGIYTYPTTGSTDGLWANIDVGNSGLSGVRLDTGSQNITNLHVWGSGLESDTDKDGVWLNSASNSLTGNWQSEKNLGRGIRVTASSNKIVGGYSWGNTLGAIYGLGASNNTIVGNQFYRNSTANTSGSTTIAYAVILLENSTRNTIEGNTFWDNSNALDPNSYTTAPTYPYTGRAAGTFSHVLLYAESGTSDYNVFVGNSAPHELTRLNGTTSSLVITGNNDVFADNLLGANPLPDRSVVSGVIRVPSDTDMIFTSATNDITSVLGHRSGRRVTIVFTAATPGTVRDNGTTLNLAGDFAAHTGSSLTLISDGTNWYEVSRSQNS